MTYATYDTGTDTAAPFELYEFTVPGSTLVWRYTNQPAAVTYSGQEYTPATIAHEQIAQQAGSVGASTSIEVADDNPLAVALLAGLSSRPVQVTIREIHRDDPDQQPATVFVGLVTGVSVDGGKATLPCGSRYALASKRRVPWLTYQAGCNWEWGGTGCGVDRTAYRVSVTLAPEDQEGRAITVAAAASYADGYFSSGWIERVDTGETRFVELHVGDNLLLAAPWADVAGGYYLFPGCQKNEAYCAGVFNNLVHYLGFPRLPSLNPFNRSAYYQTGVPDIPDPGDTWDLPDGYQLVLVDQSITIDQRAWPITLSGATYYGLGLRFLPSGYAYLLVNGMAYVLTGGTWINPKDPPPSLPASLEFFIEEPVVNAHPLSGGRPLSSVTGFDAWIDATGTVECSLQFELSDLLVGAVSYDTEFVVRVRDKAVGLVRAACTISVTLQLLVSGPGGA